jgi:hypothetical protein
MTTKTFKYTIKDGPLAGKVYGPFPTGAGSVSIDALLGTPRMHSAHITVDGVKKHVYGLYKLEKEGDEFVAVYIPSAESNG